jgi:hypothetical protein
VASGPAGRGRGLAAGRIRIRRAHRRAAVVHPPGPRVRPHACLPRPPPRRAPCGRRGAGRTGRAGGLGHDRSSARRRADRLAGRGPAGGAGGGDLARAHAAQPGHLPGLSNAAAALRPGVLAPVTHLLTAAAPAADPAGPALVAEAAASLGRAPYPVPRAQAARPPAPARRGWRSAARPRARATGLANPVREEVA